MREILLNNPDKKTELIRIVDLVTAHKLKESIKKYPDGKRMGMEGERIREIMNGHHLILQRILKERLEDNTVTEHNLKSTMLYYEEHLLQEEKELFLNSTKMQVKGVVESRNIHNIIHFTQTKNLDDILKNGVISRKKLLENQKSFIFNDDFRLDEKSDYSCFSVEFPNIEMLRALKYRTDNTSWTILVFSSQILYDYECLFYYTNSASNEVRHKDVSEFKGAVALEKLFAWNQEERAHYLRDNNPTDVQSEVMIKEDVDIRYLRFCTLNDKDDFLRYQQAYPQISFQHSPDRTRLFNTRKAYNYGY